MRTISIILTLVIATPMATANEVVVAALSQNRISITANFDGSEIFLFGAVKRDTPPPPGDRLDIIATVAGPLEPVTVRRKTRRFGIWVNTQAVEVDLAPSFYSVAATNALSEILGDTEDLRHKISVDRMIRSVGAPSDIANAAEFTDALIRKRRAAGLYSSRLGRIDLTEDTLFKTRIALPANLVEGNYSVRIFLVRDKSVIDAHTTEIPVQKVGLGRWIYSLAHERPTTYGLLAVFLAVITGWLASVLFRRAS